MKKNLLFTLSFVAFIFVSCDERIAPLSANTTAPPPSTVSKTDLLSRKWFIDQIYLDVDGKKTQTVGVGTSADIAAVIFSSPNNYFIFSKDGKLEVYSEDRRGVKKTEIGTWKFLNSEKQVQLLYGAFDFTFDILKLTDKDTDFLTPKILIANLGSASNSEKQIVLLGGLARIIDDKSKEVKYGLKLIVK
jgi:hypothetical protein